MPSYSLLSWVLIHDATGKSMPWVSTTPQSLLSYVQRISASDDPGTFQENFRKVPLTARPLRKFMNAATQFLNDGIVTHIKAYIGNISTIQGTTPTHSVACQSKTVNPTTLAKLIKNGTITSTVMYCITRKSDGSVPSLEAIQRFGTLPGNLCYSEVVRAPQEKTEGIGLLATRLLPIDTKWVFPGTVAVVEISLTALVNLARVDVHISENETFHVFSQIPGGTITGIRSL